MSTHQPPTNQASQSGSGEEKTHKTKTQSGSGENDAPKSFEPPKLPLPKYQRRIWFTIVYHLSLWLVLGLITAPFFYLFAYSTSSTYPGHFGYGSIIGNKPKLTLLPNFAINNTDMKLLFDASVLGNGTAYENYVTIMSDEWKKYTTNFVNGSDCSEMFDNTTEGAFCKFDLKNSSIDYGYGDCNVTGDFGYDGNSPCFLIRFNRILDYVPDAASTIEDGDCRMDPNCCLESRVIIKCESNETNLKVEVYPKKGISLCQWPFKGQKDYHSPTAFLQIIEMGNTTATIDCFADTEELKVNGSEKKVATHILSLIVKPDPTKKS